AKSTTAHPPMGRWLTAWRSEAGAKRFSTVIGENYQCLFRTATSMASRDRFVVVVTGPDAAMRQKHAKDVLADVLQDASGTRPGS
ncbi:MAG TPA: hypothetical protein VGL86_22775, partial [Polyangia bacterium]